MSWQDFALKASAEGRAWAMLFIPILTAFATGLHLPQPGYMKKDKP